MISFLMLGSLILGLTAWIIPVVNLMVFKKHKNRNWSTASTLSISACAISLCFQILYSHHLVKIQDWAALLDTAGVSSFFSIVLLVVTITLNAITLIIYLIQEKAK